ncbi:MAG: hypothetical protein KKC79_17530 [Gammaproteobacteria bacterium]|nr:hypothetical protein [Gammaproteobacteria bacterium]MBU1441585.1 hypothetical protein [Gammaproteobacteria bacterium]MBU2287067.1 hypothetical protein [Gammaproteobacteria bacterium]MBU2410437.1 hypothetical protein [Gammaproteobacteria bacterium]
MASRPSTAPRMLERGLLCIFIGAVVLIAPHFLQSDFWRTTVAGAYIVGWFALALGIALVAVELRKRAQSRGR